MSSAAPLAGIKVLDFTRVLAGPHCTKTLLDLGAEVTKIEPPAGDVGRGGVPHIGTMSVYYIQQNAGKRNMSIDLNWPEAREIVAEMAKHADVIVENFRPGTLSRFGLGYEQVVGINPNVIYVSMTGYGQDTSWRNRPAFAPTIHAETGITATVAQHYGANLLETQNDACSHADVYTGLHGAIAVLAALQHRNKTGEGQHIDISMAAVMLSVNERAGAQLSDVDTKGEPVALSANESHIFTLADGTQITIASSPIYTPMYIRFCVMMRRTDLLRDPRFATPDLRRLHIKEFLAEVSAWIRTFESLEMLQAQVSEASLAIGVIRTPQEFAQSEFVKEWEAIVEVDDRSGSTTRMPGKPWHFSKSTLPQPGIPYYQGECNEEIMREQGLTEEQIDDLRKRRVLLSRKSPRGAYD